jgi:hypothetical protein
VPVGAVVGDEVVGDEVGEVVGDLGPVEHTQTSSLAVSAPVSPQSTSLFPDNDTVVLS